MVTVYQVCAGDGEREKRRGRERERISHEKKKVTDICSKLEIVVYILYVYIPVVY